MSGFSLTKVLFGGLTGLFMGACLTTGCASVSADAKTIGEFERVIGAYQSLAADNNLAFSATVSHGGKIGFFSTQAVGFDTGAELTVHLQGQSDHPEGGPDGE